MLTACERRWTSILWEMTGYALTTRTPAQRIRLRSTVVEIFGDSKCAEVIFRKGGSQAAFDDETGELLLLKALLDITGDAEREGFEVRLRWVPRALVQHANDLSKYEDRHDFGLNRYWRRQVLTELGPSALDDIIDRFAAPHSAVSPSFIALFDAPDVEAADAFAEDWSGGWSYLIPPFTKIDAVLGKLERDNAGAALVAPVWKSRGWLRRLASGAWIDRIDARRALPPTALSVHPENAKSCFFGPAFASPLVALSIVPLLAR